MRIYGRQSFIHHTNEVSSFLFYDLWKYAKASIASAGLPFKMRSRSVTLSYHARTRTLARMPMISDFLDVISIRPYLLLDLRMRGMYPSLRTRQPRPWCSAMVQIHTTVPEAQAFRMLGKQLLPTMFYTPLT
jgi:hypothetical protein